MEYRLLGSTELEVSAIGFGALHLSLPPSPPEKAAIATLHYVLSRGITLIDTADCYCASESDMHHNETLIRRALEQYPGDTSRVVVATKGGIIRPGGAWTAEGNPTYLCSAIRASWHALGGRRPIDLWQYHCPDPRYPIQQAMEAAAMAVREGWVRLVGLSNVTVDQIRAAREVTSIASVQNQYNPWRRIVELNGLIAFCEREGIAFLPWSPFGGRSRGGQLRLIDGLANLAAETGLSVHALTIAWMRAKSPSVVPIPGAARADHVDDWIGGLAPLPPGCAERLDQAMGRMRMAVAV